MKKIIKPYEREESVFYSDFTGKDMGENGSDIDLKINFNYGSKRDGATIELHLTDEDIQPILDLIKNKLSPDVKKVYKKKLDKLDKSFNDSMGLRDWGSCDQISNDLWLLRELLDMSIYEE